LSATVGLALGSKSGVVDGLITCKVLDLGLQAIHILQLQQAVRVGLTGVRLQIQNQRVPKLLLAEVLAIVSSEARQDLESGEVKQLGLCVNLYKCKQSKTLPAQSRRAQE